MFVKKKVYINMFSSVLNQNVFAPLIRNISLIKFEITSMYWFIKERAIKLR